MNKKLKKELKRLYEAPEAQRKREFLEKIEEPEIGFITFLKTQLPYIRKWNWILAFVLFGIVLFFSIWIQKSILWSIGALVPFLAFTTILESNRSVQYGMEELELSSRFSLKMIVMARLFILGVSNLILLVILIPLVLWKERQMNWIYTGMMILIPYLLTAFSTLMIVRRIHGRESLYFSFGVTGIVSGLYLILAGIQYPAEQNINLGMLVSAGAVLAGLTAVECIKTMKQSEEYVWNL